MDYIAHIRSLDKEIQTVKQHLLETKEIAENLGEKLCIRHITGLTAVLHDLGKATNNFNDYIFTAVHHPERARSRGSVDHSTAGGKLLYELFHKTESSVNDKILVEIVGNAIISHHNYLKDYVSDGVDSEFLARVVDKEVTEYDTAVSYFFENIMSEVQFRSYYEEAKEELTKYLEKCKKK